MYICMYQKSRLIDQTKGATTPTYLPIYLPTYLAVDGGLVPDLQQVIPIHHHRLDTYPVTKPDPHALVIEREEEGTREQPEVVGAEQVVDRLHEPVTEVVTAP